MINCSKRRKTKHPYCSDDPRCYWKGKTCKRKKTKETVSKDNIKKLSKLDIILKKVSIIENYLIEMNKSKKKVSYNRTFKNNNKKIYYNRNSKNNNNKKLSYNRSSKNNALKILKEI